MSVKAIHSGTTRLGEFIRRDIDGILRDWDDQVAASVTASQHVSPLSLRGHARQILESIIADLPHPRAAAECPHGTDGLDRAADQAHPTAAHAHAVSRAESGFTIEQLTCEYHALRARVLGGWINACAGEPPFVGDIVRFDAAIDRALSESLCLFAAHTNRARNLLLGMLSHDLRSPLQTIQMTARVLQRLHASADIDHAAELLVRSGARMKKLLEEQIDFNRAELGLVLGVQPHEVDLGPLCAQELEQILAAYPERALKLEVTGDCSGAWDSGRFQQMLNNLVVNAVHYGEPQEAIHVSLYGAAADVRLTVANAGEPIDDDTLRHIFEPMRRGRVGALRHDSGLGLGLYIASEIAKAHGGAIAAESDARKTIFTVNLPKHADGRQGARNRIDAPSAKAEASCTSLG